MKKTKSTNPHLRKLISDLYSWANKEKAAIWKIVAKELEKPARRRREVNLSRLSRYLKDGETAVVPGKVLGCGELTKKVTIAAWNFSQSAREKIKKAGGRAITIRQLYAENKNGSKVKIIG